jgi:glycerate kinase
VIPQTVLVVSGPFGTALSAGDVARAIARGLHAGGLAQSDLCPIEIERSTEIERSAQTDNDPRAATGRDRRSHRRADAPDVAALLAGLDFDARMRRGRAVVLAEERLRESTLRGSVAFEIATRARQGGVPAYAVSAENALGPFDARMLDLQLIVEAASSRALAAAGRKLAQVL